ncbi:hypothetical protein FOZ63_027101 [Perkinsus olseni]|uniref:RING-type domain-containing protein n=1 Tax=Perkinsus olseni TaxID=32597 RepID=A0A7J6SPK0_PEROL|nr:hypothetical protein FOZ63_027101 [Perkinsus olseni]
MDSRRQHQLSQAASACYVGLVVAASAALLTFCFTNLPDTVRLALVIAIASCFFLAGVVVRMYGKGFLRVLSVRYARRRFKTAEGLYIEAQTQGTCSICLSEYDPGHMMVRLNCGHVYHLDCASSWISLGSSRRTCPLCRCTVEFERPSLRALVFGK